MAQDVYLLRQSVSLDAGASVVVTHGLVARGVAATPNVVYPDRGTDIYVAVWDATTVTFTNPTAAALSAVFYVQYVHSINATQAQCGPGLIWKGGSGGAGTQDPFVGTNEYYVDTTATVTPSMRLYPTIALAIAAAEADAAIVATGANIQLREGQAHVLDLAAAGLAVASTLKVCLFAVDARATLSIHGTAPAGGADAAIRFYNLKITQSAAMDTGAARAVIIDKCAFDHAGFAFSYGVNGVVGYGSNITSPRYTAGGELSLGVLLQDCVINSSLADATPILFDNGLIFGFTNCQFDLSETNMAAFCKKAAAIPGAAVSLLGCTIKQNNAGAGTALLFDVGSTNGTIAGTTLSARSSGGGTTAFGMTAGTGTGTGLIVTPAQNVATITGLPVTATVLNGARVFAKSSAGQVIVDAVAAAIVVFGTQIVDTAFAYDPVTGIFVAPYAGTFRVSAGVRYAPMPAASVVSLEIFGGPGAGATFVKNTLNVISTGSGSVSISADVPLAEGESMTVRTALATGGAGDVALTVNNTENYLTISYVA